jgi:hypothetical protein
VDGAAGEAGAGATGDDGFAITRGKLGDFDDLVAAANEGDGFGVADVDRAVVFIRTELVLLPEDVLLAADLVQLLDQRGRLGALGALGAPEQRANHSADRIPL